MAAHLQRRTVYAITIVSLLALAGSWAFAATVVTQHPPPMNSTVTVVNPGGASEVVQSTQMVALTPDFATYLAANPAGAQAGSGQGLNSTGYGTLLLGQCAQANCSGNFSAVDATNAVASEDMALQVSIIVNQTQVATGFDVQVEINFMSQGGSPEPYAFGSAYFDTGTSLATTGYSSITVFVFVGLGAAAINPPSIQNVVVTLNDCTSATTCP
jgi:hypothetical protein